MATIALPKRGRSDTLPGVPAVRQGLTWVRRFPVLPGAVLLFLLIIPGIFANQIAPHDYRIGDLDLVKRPPTWIGDKIVDQTVDRTVARQGEITLKSADRRIDRAPLHSWRAASTGPWTSAIK